MSTPQYQAPTRVCSACGTLSQTGKPFCPECGTTYGEPGGGRSSGLTYGAFACAGISTLFFPIVLGPVAIVLASVALSRKEPHAGLALGLSIAGMIIGVIIGAIVWTT